MARSLPDYAKGVQVQYDPTADVMHGPGMPLNWGDEKSVDNTGAVEIVPGKQKRVGWIIQAKASNTGIVYLGFDPTVTTTKWFAELLPGMAACDNTYCGEVCAIADVAAAQKVGWAEW